MDQLGQSIFLEMFGDPATNPMKWPVVTIGDLLESATYGISEKAEPEGTLPILRMNNITRYGRLNLDDLKFINLIGEDINRYIVQDGDILFNRTNSPELVGKTAVFRIKNKMAYAGYLIRLRVNSDAFPEYISSFLNSRYGKLTLRKMCKTIIGMSNINATEVQGIKIPKPPVGLQERFFERLSGIEKTRLTLEESSAKLSALFVSIQHRAFKGDL
ncbi:MAG: restriction endonuclease subunit S [Nitrospiraceae bacterium]